MGEWQHLNTITPHNYLYPHGCSPHQNLGGVQRLTFVQPFWTFKITLKLLSNCMHYIKILDILHIKILDEFNVDLWAFWTFKLAQGQVGKWQQLVNVITSQKIPESCNFRKMFSTLKSLMHLTLTFAWLFYCIFQTIPRSGPVEMYV